MYNIIVAGVGGQGLVLATGIIAQAGLKAGYDVKTNDVVGLSQRGGTVWGTVRIGSLINSPNIPYKEADFILGMEPLEAYRWSYLLKDNANIIINTKEVYPTPSLLEQVAYPNEAINDLDTKFNVSRVNALEESRLAGNIKAANTFMIGVLAKYLDIPTHIWEEVLRENVPKKAIEDNIRAFHRGYNIN